MTSAPIEEGRRSTAALGLKGASRIIIQGLLVAGLLVCGQLPTSLFGQAFELRDQRASVGAFDGAIHETLGWVMDAAFAPDGGFLVIDTQMRAVLWYGPDGSFRDMLDRHGGGPGELRYPKSLAIRGDGVHVLDVGNSRITEYALDDEGLEFRGQRRLTFGSVADLCFVHDRLFVLASDGAALIAEVDTGGEPVARFAPPVEPDARGRLAHARTSLRERYNTAMLECDPASDRIFLIHTLIGRVRAFTVAGDSLWAVDLPDYKRPDWTATPDGHVSPFRSISDRIHEVTAAATTSDLLLLTLWDGGTAGSDHVLELRVLKSSNGLQLEGRPAEQRITDIELGRALTHSRRPFPVVSVWSYSIR